jgi:murein DD-endopeptidase MepM/ murein hydrolase activator NlpD
MTPITKIRRIPTGDHPGAFGVKRRHHTHEGVDLYCEEGTEVRSLANGLVVWIGPFTGEVAGSPWWMNTQAVAIEHEFGVMFYGEIIPRKDLKVGDHVGWVELIGKVTRVLRNDKGTPTAMLHMELYESLPAVLPPALWVNERPAGLLDPTEILQKSIDPCPDCGAHLQAQRGGGVRCPECAYWFCY